MGIVTEDGRWGNTLKPLKMLRGHPARALGSHRAGHPRSQAPRPRGPPAARVRGPSRQRDERQASPVASPQAALTFSSSVLEAAFLASDFDRVVRTEPQARASQSVPRSAFMAGMSQQRPALGFRGLPGEQGIWSPAAARANPSADWGTCHNRAWVLVALAPGWSPALDRPAGRWPRLLSQPARKGLPSLGPQSCPHCPGPSSCWPSGMLALPSPSRLKTWGRGLFQLRQQQQRLWEKMPMGKNTKLPIGKQRKSKLGKKGPGGGFPSVTCP